MVRIIPYAERLAFPVRIEEAHRNDVLRVNASVIAQSQRPVVGRVADGAPEVYDLEALLQQLRNILRWKMAVDTRDSCFAALVDVDAGDWLTGVGFFEDFTGAPTTDS